MHYITVKPFAINVMTAVEARIRIGWNKFRQLVPLLTNKDVSLIIIIIFIYYYTIR